MLALQGTTAQTKTNCLSDVEEVIIVALEVLHAQHALQDMHAQMAMHPKLPVQVDFILLLNLSKLTISNIYLTNLNNFHQRILILSNFYEFFNKNRVSVLIFL